MKKLLFGSLLGSFLAMPVHADPATLEEILRELASLNARVAKLEEANGRLLAENAELRTNSDRRDAVASTVGSSSTTQAASADGSAVAVDGSAASEAERLAKAAQWASRLAWKTDLRYRHEYVNPEEAAADQTRHRIRARLGLTARINDSVSATVGLATNGGSNDPRSTNQTLGEGSTRKGLSVDLAYVDWKPIRGFSMQFGKMPQPWQKVSGLFFDNDITPEGLSAKHASGPFFASAFGYYLSERSTASDATLLGGQVGMTGSVGGVDLLGALGYFDVGGAEGQVTTLSPGCAPNGAFFGGPQGNTNVTDAFGCARLANDFNMIDVIAQAEMTLADRPLVLFAEYVQNREADDLDSGYELGFNFGKAADPHTWELGYAYHVTEKDAQFGQFVDSDFGGGITDVDGGVFRFGYAPAKNWVLNGTWFLNNRFVDATGATEQDYERYQLDLNFKF